MISSKTERNKPNKHRLHLDFTMFSKNCFGCLKQLALDTSTLLDYHLLPKHLLRRHWYLWSSTNQRWYAQSVRNPLPMDTATHRQQLKRKPNPPEQAKSLRVAIIGAPNAGKSTLSNQLMERNVAAVSSKVHTTRKQASAVKTIGNTQLVLLDTPGIITIGKSKRFKLDRRLLEDPHNSMRQADLIAVVVDVSHVWHRVQLDKEILKVLYLNQHIPSVLVLNKVDLLKRKQMLLETVRLLTEGVVDGYRNDSSEDITIEDVERKMKEKMFNKSRKLLHNDMDCYAKEYTDEQFLENDHNANSLELAADTIWTPDCDSSGNATNSTTAGTDSDKAVAQLGDKKFDWSVYKQSLEEAWKATRHRKGWDKFKRVFMTSASLNDGVQPILDYMLSNASARSWDFHSSVVTDQSPSDIIKQAIWGELLDKLPAEIPYNVDVRLAQIEESDGTLYIECHLMCKSNRYAMHCMGPKGSVIREISMIAEELLENTFQQPVILKIIIKSEKIKK